MKKLIILFLLTVFSVTMINAQSIWKPVPKDLFTSKIVPGKLQANGIEASKWLWRLSAQVTADELIYNKTEKQLTSSPLSSVGPAIGFRHYVALSDGTPYANYGFSAAVLLGTNINQIDPAKIKIALCVNAFNYINFGGAYTLNVPSYLSPWSILVGASVYF